MWLGLCGVSENRSRTHLLFSLTVQVFCFFVLLIGAPPSAPLLQCCLPSVLENKITVNSKCSQAAELTAEMLLSMLNRRQQIINLL